MNDQDYKRLLDADPNHYEGMRQSLNSSGEPGGWVTLLALAAIIWLLAT